MTDELRRLGRAESANEQHRAVTIRGDVVLRPAKPATPATPTVHAYLRHLRAAGITEVPKPLGIDGDVELLRLIEGESGGDGWYHQHDDRGLTSAARLLRRIHDAGADWTPPRDAVWGADPVPGNDTVPNHGDPGPWNFVRRDHEAVGLIDWDYLHPAPRLADVGYALRWFSPMRSDEITLQWHHFPTVPDRRQRARTFVDAYGDLPPFDHADAAVTAIRDTAARVAELARQGVEPQRTWVADGALEAEQAEARWIEEHRDLL